MRRDEVRELHFITHIANLPSIQEHGIVARNFARRQGILFTDISNQSVQDRRANKRVIGTDKVLHDFANLYFDAHNPMLSARRAQNDEICVLRISNGIMDREGVIITDKNAARECWFKSVAEGLDLLNTDEIYATYWVLPNQDYWEQERLKGIKCAEVLVPNVVEPDYLLGGYVANQKSLEYFQRVSNLVVEIKIGLFF